MHKFILFTSLLHFYSETHREGRDWLGRVHTSAVPR